MNALRIHTRLDSTTLSLPELAPFIGKHVELIVLEAASSSGTQPVQRALGTLGDRFVVPEDFDAPLPPELLALFDGESRS